MALGLDTPCKNLQSLSTLSTRESSRCPSLGGQHALVSPYPHAQIIQNSKVWVGSRLKVLMPLEIINKFCTHFIVEERPRTG